MVLRCRPPISTEPASTRCSGRLRRSAGAGVPRPDEGPVNNKRITSEDTDAVSPDRQHGIVAGTNVSIEPVSNEKPPATMGFIHHNQPLHQSPPVWSTTAESLLP
jgi:hypothetical protein